LQTEKETEAYFIVRDANGQALAYVACRFKGGPPISYSTAPARLTGISSAIPATLSELSV
jgi:hypothetical protein